MPYGQLNSDVTSSEAFAIDFQQKFERQILDEIIPSVENTYRVTSDARHRAMAGVSMGGMQTAFIGLNHPETFSTIAMWSSAIFDDPAVLLANLVTARENIKHSFLYIHVGVGREDPLLAGSNEIDEFLTSQEIDHEFMPYSWNP